MVRLFIGIPLPPPQKLALSTVCQGMQGVRWVDPGNFHVTLRFIGEVDEGVAIDIHEALDTVKASRLSLAIAGMGVFGSPEKPRMVYAALDREPALFQLRERTEAALMRIGLPPETRRYTPHVTLGQCRTANPLSIQSFIAANNLIRLQPFNVAEFHLIRSYLTKAGSIYEEAAAYPLR